MPFLESHHRRITVLTEHADADSCNEIKVLCRYHAGKSNVEVGWKVQVWNGGESFTLLHASQHREFALKEYVQAWIPDPSLTLLDIYKITVTCPGWGGKGSSSQLRYTSSRFELATDLPLGRVGSETSPLGYDTEEQMR